ncbi:hypothetical protein [Mycoplasma zalophidermidis]|uniref:Uncharacterized protein n=1 Tax=Mycoplasma zalophidermidis TaxID=398174 RepID=A0ABS6DRJ6_9MOLU|nr:hypothetical protein [Mycoplasma zalophidermidis]MBU4693546.1 hypothetical protein [Mycoplasma zalophidermidis]MCR8966495.1 hypothetical protein [Mycoplasma zalophidermidis]
MAKFINKTLRTSIGREDYFNEIAGHFGFELKGSQDISQGNVKLDFTIDTDSNKNAIRLGSLFQQFLDLEERKKTLKEQLSNTKINKMAVLILLLFLIIPGVLYIMVFKKKLRNIQDQLNKTIEEQKSIYQMAVELQGGISENIETLIEN